MRTFAPDFLIQRRESNKLHIKRFKTVTNYYKLSGKCKPESKPRTMDKVRIANDTWEKVRYAQKNERRKQK